MTAKIAIGSRVLTTPEILRRGRQAATGLTSLGIVKGDVIALMLRNDFAFLEASYAAGQIGVYATPINWHNSAEEVRYVLIDSGAKALVVHTDLLDRIASTMPSDVVVFGVETPADICAAYNLPPAPLPAHITHWNDWLNGFAERSEAALPSPGAMFYTSGTTGRPKGVRRHSPTPELDAPTLEMFLALTGIGPWQDRPSEAVALIGGPLYHGTPNGWANALLPMGVNLVIELRFNAEETLRHIETFGATHALLVPTMFVRLLRLPETIKTKYDLSSLKFVMHGGAPCSPHVKRAMIDWLGPIISEHYGSTEVGAITYCDTPEWLAHPGTVGCPISHCKVAILDSNNEMLGPNETGDIVCRNFGYVDFTYHGDDAKRKKAERAGLISLGDIGYLDTDGFLYLCSRSAEIIISGGTNIYPAEIEAELLKIPGVADCAVFGIPDEEYGEKVCAYVQAQSGFELETREITGVLRQRLAGYKTPKVIKIVAELPREDSGKVFKKRLRDPYWDAADLAFRLL